MEKEYNAIDCLFNIREEEFLEEIGDNKESLNSIIKGTQREEIIKLISKIPNENANLKEQITSGLNSLIADYNILVSYYNKKYYKQGFEDATNLMKICGK